MRQYCIESCEVCPLSKLNPNEKEEAVKVLSDLMDSFPHDSVLRLDGLGLLREDVVEIVSYENGLWPNPDAIAQAAVRIASGGCIVHPQKARLSVK